MIYIELGWFPIEIAIKVKMMSYWVRLLTGKETKISYLSYKSLYDLFNDENLDFSWIKHCQMNVKENRRDNQEWTIQRNRQHY